MSSWKQLPESQQRLLQAIKIFYYPEVEFSRPELNSKLEENGVENKTTTGQLNQLAKESELLEITAVGGHPFILDTGAQEDELKTGITSEDFRSIAAQVANRHDIEMAFQHVNWESWEEVVKHVNSTVGESVLTITATPNKYSLTREGYQHTPMESVIKSVFQGKENDVKEIIKGAIRTGESETVEFKESLPDYAKKIAPEIVALGNHKGGVLVIGISDDRTVEGVSEISEVEERVTGVIQESVQGPIPEIRKATYSGENLLVIRVPKRDGGFYTVDGTECYRRVGTSKKRMEISEILSEWSETNRK